MTNTLYDILGVAPNADQATIKQAYRHLMKKYHPDQNDSPAAAVKFKEVRNAYDILGDPIKRQQYDQQMGTNSASGQPQQRWQGQSASTNSRPRAAVPTTQWRQRWWLLPVGLLAVVLIWTGYRGIAKNYNQAAQWQATRTVLAGHSISKLTTVVKSTDPLHAPVTNRSIKPFYKYLHADHNQNLARIEQTIQAQQSNLHFVQTGHRWLIFPQYQLELTPIAPTVITNRADVTIKLAGQKLSGNQTGQPQQFKPVLPGLYQAVAETTVNGKALKQSVNWNSVTAQPDEAPLDLSMHIVNLKVTSNIANGDVYLDGKQVGQLIGNTGQFSLLLSNQANANHLQVRLKKTSSATQTIVSNQQAVKLDAQVATEHAPELPKIEEFVTALFKNMNQTASGQKPADGQNTAAYFIHGKANASYQAGYQKFLKSQAQVLSTDKLNISKQDARGYHINFKIMYQRDGQDAEQLPVDMIIKQVTKKDGSTGYQVVEAGPDKTNQKLAGQSDTDTGGTTSVQGPPTGH